MCAYDIFIHPSLDGHLDYFRMSAIMNRTIMNMSADTLLDHIFISFN